MRRAAVTALAVVALAVTPLGADVPRRYTVTEGDALTSIAAALDVPGGFRRLAYVNRRTVDHPDLIVEGQQLVLPERDGKRIDYVPRRPTVAASRSQMSSAGAGVVLAGAPSSTAPVEAPSHDWYAVAACESGGDWSANTGNGYYGGLQFSLSSWRAVGGTGFPHEHSAATQIAMGERLLAIQGAGAWPHCGRFL